MKLEKSLTVENMNQRVLGIEYAFRGPIVQRAAQIERELEKGVRKPFNHVVYSTIADAHALGQKPITFIRQVLSAVTNPTLLESPYLPKDVKKRAQELLGECKQQSIGAYSPYAGLQLVRRHIAEFIAKRDGVPASPEDVYMSAGASDIVKSVLTLFAENVDGKPSCKILVLSRVEIEMIIKFAFERNIFIISDEVYQENIAGKTFLSFRKVMHEMGPPYSGMELASFFAASKGWAAESGLRSGYGELVRMHPRVIDQLLTMRNVLQCPTVLGQCALDCVVKRPVPGDESYKLFDEEVRVIQRMLAERYEEARKFFNSIPGYFCNYIHGGIVAYPRFEIPERAQRLAADLHMSPDEFYVMRLLEEKGVCVIPGTGFGQRPGTFHFRATILQPQDQFQYMMDSIRDFHIKFVEKYS